MADLQLDAAHDVEVVLFHEVVHGVDAAHRAVLDGEDAVVAQPLFHRLEHPLEIAEEGDVRDLEQLVRGDGGVAPFHALTCDGRGDGEISLALHERASELVGEGSGGRDQPALIGTRGLHNCLKHTFKIDFLLVICLFRHFGDDFLFACGVEDGGVGLCLFLADEAHGVLPFKVERRDLVVDVVDPVSQFFKRHMSPQILFFVSCRANDMSRSRSDLRRFAQPGLAGGQTIACAPQGAPRRGERAPPRLPPPPPLSAPPSRRVCL